MRLTLAALLLSSTAAAAQDTEALFDLLRMPEMIEIMAQEGVAQGETIDADVLEGQGGAGWAATVSQIYAPEAMTDRARQDFDAALQGIDTGPMVDFFATPLGKEIIALELSARAAMLDDDVEQAARARVIDEHGGDRLTLIDRFTEAADLLDRNVEGALNANYAFFQGLAQVGGLPSGLTEEQIVEEVWQAEPETRADTGEWIDAYLLMAYDPLSDDDLAIYTAFIESDAGQRFVDASFAAYDGMYLDISRALGAAMGQAAAGSSL